MSCFVYKVIRDLELIDHLCINPIQISIHISLSGVYKLMFYLTIVNKTRRHCHSWLAGQKQDMVTGVQVEGASSGLKQQKVVSLENFNVIEKKLRSLVISINYLLSRLFSPDIFHFHDTPPPPLHRNRYLSWVVTSDPASVVYVSTVVRISPYQC